MIGMALGILSAGAKFAQGSAAASAANEQSMRAYAQQLKIREQQWKNSRAVYGNKLIQYKQNMQHADRAASRAYGAEQIRQSQAMDKAVFANRKLDIALAKSGGLAGASGASGLSAQRRDSATEGAVVRSQAMITQNLLQGSINSSYRKMQIKDQLDTTRNQLFGNVAIAPIKPIAPQAPMMQSGPSPLGLGLNIGSAIINNLPTPAPDPGTL